MSNPYKVPNTILRHKETGEMATTCYNGLDGIGIKWGEHNFDTSRNWGDHFPEPDEIITDPQEVFDIVDRGGWP